MARIFQFSQTLAPFTLKSSVCFYSSCLIASFLGIVSNCFLPQPSKDHNFLACSGNSKSTFLSFFFSKGHQLDLIPFRISENGCNMPPRHLPFSSFFVMNLILTPTGYQGYYLAPVIDHEGLILTSVHVWNYVAAFSSTEPDWEAPWVQIWHNITSLAKFRFNNVIW